jgi:hypothetical protein
MPHAGLLLLFFPTLSHRWTPLARIHHGSGHNKTTTPLREPIRGAANRPFTPESRIGYPQLQATRK